MDAEKATVSVNEEAISRQSRAPEASAIEQVLRILLWSIGPQRASKFVAGLIDSGRLADAKIAVGAMVPKPADGEIFPLTDIQVSANFQTVIPSYQDLLQRLHAVTSRRGAKADLARHVHASMSEVTLWISGKRIPNGDTTLQILQWVEDEERKPKSSASALTPAEPKTRRKQNKHELPKSSPAAD
ncbi:MAG: hypothetical protein KIT22_08875 [Verrucomicrobiae bacterium]|nr:hypothetical protein [Verrucomicrobiae bacterium]